MTTETLLAIFAVLLTISLGAERFMEVFKPLLDKVAEKWRSSIKIIVAILVGFGLAALFRFDILAKLMITGNLPVISYALTGLIASTGSTTINRILEWLKTLRNDTMATVTKTITKGTTATTVTAEVKSESGRTPVGDTVQAAVDAVIAPPEA